MVGSVQTRVARAMAVPGVAGRPTQAFLLSEPSWLQGIAQAQGFVVASDETGAQFFERRAAPWSLGLGFWRDCGKEVFYQLGAATIGGGASTVSLLFGYGPLPSLLLSGALGGFGSTLFGAFEGAPPSWTTIAIRCVTALATAGVVVDDPASFGFQAVVAGVIALKGTALAAGVETVRSNWDRWRWSRKCAAAVDEVITQSAAPQALHAYFAQHPKAALRFVDAWMPAWFAHRREPIDAELAAIQRAQNRLRADYDTARRQPLDPVRLGQLIWAYQDAVAVQSAKIDALKQRLVALAAEEATYAPALAIIRAGAKRLLAEQRVTAFCDQAAAVVTADWPAADEVVEPSPPSVDPVTSTPVILEAAAVELAATAEVAHCDGR